jgi:hypothetical protein
VRGFTDIIKEAQMQAEYSSMGLTAQDFNIYSEYNHDATLFGKEIAQSKRKEKRKVIAYENAHCDYDFYNMEVYSLRKYHEDCKFWLDLIKYFNLPIQMESTDSSTKYHDGDFNYTTYKSKIWRFRDLETKYSMDFSVDIKEIEEDEKKYRSGKSAHVKYIWALPEDQGNYFKVNKSLRRFAKILFIDKYDYLEGWASRINQMPVRQGRNKNWRARKVKMKDNKGNLSKNKGIALLAMWLRAGFIISGTKKDDCMIAYISPNSYKYLTLDDSTSMDDSFKYARNLPYEINTTYKV